MEKNTQHRNNIFNFLTLCREKLDAALYAVFPPSFCKEADRLKKSDPTLYTQLKDKHEKDADEMARGGWIRPSPEGIKRSIVCSIPRKTIRRVSILWRFRYLFDNSYRTHICRDLASKEWEQGLQNLRNDPEFQVRMKLFQEKLDLEFFQKIPKFANYWKSTIPNRSIS